MKKPFTSEPMEEGKAGKAEANGCIKNNAKEGGMRKFFFGDRNKSVDETIDSGGNIAPNMKTMQAKSSDNANPILLEEVFDESRGDADNDEVKDDVGVREGVPSQMPTCGVKLMSGNRCGAENEVVETREDDKSAYKDIDNGNGMVEITAQRLETDEEEAMKIATRTDFRELSEKFFKRYKLEERNGSFAREWVTEAIQMDKPRHATRQRTTSGTCLKQHTVRVGESDSWFNFKSTSGCLIKKVEERGITMRQLRAIKANIDRRCVLEKWVNSEGNLLTPKTVTFNDINKYITKPFTFKNKRSLVEELPSTAGTQPPRWYVSHSWDKPFEDFFACLVQHMEEFRENENETDERRGGGMTEDTPIWISAFALNQWKDTGNRLNVISSSYKAMKLADYRLISIFDKKGDVLKNLWFIFELYLGLIVPIKSDTESKKTVRNWCLYTVNDDSEIARIAVNHEDTLLDGSDNAFCRGFPFDIILQSLEMKVEDGKSTVKFDHEGILEFIIALETVKGLRGMKFSLDPPKTHESYSAVNDGLRAFFATIPGALQFAYNRIGWTSANSDVGAVRDWKAMLTAMSKGKISNGINLSFHEDEFMDSEPTSKSNAQKQAKHILNWDNLTSGQASKLIQHLPSSTESLTISFAPFGYPFFSALATWIKRAKNIKVLNIEKSFVGRSTGPKRRSGREAGIRLAEALSSNETIKELRLDETDLIGSRNVSAWTKALGRNRTLKTLYSKGMSSYAEHVLYVGVSDLNYQGGSDTDSNCESEIDDKSRSRSVSSEVTDGSVTASAVVCPYDRRQKLYYIDGTFPDAMLGKNGVKKLAQDGAIAYNNVLSTVDLEDHMNFLAADGDNVLEL